MNFTFPHISAMYLAAAGVAALVVIAFAARVLRRVWSAGGAADALTFVVAGMATVMSGQGMWWFFTNDLHVTEIYIRVCMFGVFEAAMLVCALRTRRRIKKQMPVGIVGPAVWVMATLSGVLAATDVGWHFGPMLARLAAPLIAAFLWELGLSEERIAAGNSRVKWRITPERILVRLGLAEGKDRTVTEVDAHRRLSRLARAAMRVRALRATGGKGRRLRFAQYRLHRAMDAAVEHADLGADPTRHEALMSQIGALYNATALAELTPTAPWQTPTPGNTPGNTAENALTGVSENTRPALPHPVLNTPPGNARTGVTPAVRRSRPTRADGASSPRGAGLPEGVSTGRDLDADQVGALIRDGAAGVPDPSVRQVMHSFAVSYDKATSALRIAKNTAPLHAVNDA